MKTLNEYKKLFKLRKRDHKYYITRSFRNRLDPLPYKFIVIGDPYGKPKGTWDLGDLRDDLDEKLNKPEEKRELTYTSFACGFSSMTEALDYLYNMTFEAHNPKRKCKILVD